MTNCSCSGWIGRNPRWKKSELARKKQSNSHPAKGSMRAPFNPAAAEAAARKGVDERTSFTPFSNETHARAQLSAFYMVRCGERDLIPSALLETGPLDGIVLDRENKVQ